MKWWQGRRRVLIVAGAVVVLVGLGLGWALWPEPEPPARERQYGSATACLLTDDRGLAGERARTVWTAMQEASVASLVKVQYLSITGPQTAANGSAYFNSLAIQGCALIVAVGDVPVATMSEAGERFTGIRYVAVDGAATAVGITTVDEAAEPELARRIGAFVTEVAPSDD